MQPSALLTPEVEANLCLTPEQREAKLRRVERIRERVIRRWADFFRLLFLPHLPYLNLHVLSFVSANWWFYPPFSAARESACTPSPAAVQGEGKEALKGTSDMARRLKSGTNTNIKGFIRCVFGTFRLQISCFLETRQNPLDHCSNYAVSLESRTTHKDLEMGIT